VASKAAIEGMIKDMETKLQQTKDDLTGQRGPVIDALKVVLPMQEDTVKILREIAGWINARPNHN